MLTPGPSLGSIFITSFGANLQWPPDELQFHLSATLLLLVKQSGSFHEQGGPAWGQIPSLSYCFSLA